MRLAEVSRVRSLTAASLSRKTGMVALGRLMMSTVSALPRMQWRSPVRLRLKR
jgi:hypothetical protein